MKCIICSKKLAGKQTKFCSRVCHNKCNNHYHQSYSKQKARGLERKIKIVESMGSKCSSCGYHKNLAALQFHHINPNEKESQLDMRKLSNSTWEWCLKEASKCKLLCANCHTEHHHPKFQNFNGHSRT